MNEKLIRKLNIWGAVFAIVGGSILHFVYRWSGNNLIIGLFSPVNESPWEHMKLVFTPLIIFAFVDYYYLRDVVKNYCFALIKQIGVAIIFILVVFYIYTQFAGESILAIDIGSFVIGIILAKWLGYKILTGRFNNREFRGINTISAILLVILTAFFFYATINPPKTHLFMDENTNNYGIPLDN